MWRFDCWELQEGVEKSYEAGQQSKQAEVDELRKRIDLALEYIEPSDNINHKAYRDLYKILNGDQS